MNPLKRLWNWLTTKDVPSPVIEPIAIKLVALENITKGEPVIITSTPKIRDSYFKKIWDESRKTHEETLEEKIRKSWLPEPTTKRKTVTRRQQTSKHHDVNKFFKGSGKGQLPSYRKSVHNSKNIPIEEGDENS